MCRKTTFPDLFCYDKKTLFTRFENLFLTPSPNGESRHPQAAVICGPSQNVYDGEKKFRKNTVISEKIGVKDFSLGVISRLSKLSKRKVVSYMGASVLGVRGSKMSIFKESFPMCHVFVHF